MSSMPQPFKCPKTGTYYYRRGIPDALRPLLGKREWKVSLRTKDFTEARVLFSAEAARCEAVFASARAQLEGRILLQPADAPRLADKWATKVIAEWSHSPAALSLFIASSEDYDVPLYSVLDLETQNQREVQVQAAIVQELQTHSMPLPGRPSLVYSALVDAFFRRWVSLCDLAVSYTAGEWTQRLELPKAEEPLTSQKTQDCLTLSAVLASWVRAKRADDGSTRSVEKTIAEFSAVVRCFIDLYGDLPVRDIDRTLCQSFREALASLPAPRRGRAKKGAAVAAESEERPSLATATVRKKLRCLSAVLNFARQRLNAIDEEPISSSGMLKSLAKATRKAERRSAEEKSYSRSQLRTIFGSGLFRGEWKPPQADYGEALYWLPLLLLYTGARLEELAQLRVDDVSHDSDFDLWCLVIAPGAEKSVKTDSSRRRVPLHDDLLALGFIDYVKRQPIDGRVFPKLLSHPVQGYGFYVGRVWSRYLRDVLKLQTKVAPFHGFRHTFKTLSREAGIAEEVSSWIVGHAAVNVSGTYGTQPLKRMAEELKRFPSIARMAGLLDS